MNSSVLECADPKPAGSTIRTGNLAVNIDEGLVSVDGDPVKLTPREYEILELLYSRRGTIVTKEMFLTAFMPASMNRSKKSSISSSVSCGKS